MEIENKNRAGAGMEREDVGVKGMVAEVAGYLREREIRGGCNNLNLSDTIIIIYCKHYYLGNEPFCSCSPCIYRP